MQFHTRNLQTNEGVRKEVCLLNERLELLCHLRAREDSKAAWLGGFLRTLETPESAEQSQWLVMHVTRISNCEYRAHERVTFLRMAHALLAFLERAEAEELNGHREASEALRRFLDRQYSFQATCDDTVYTYRVLANGNQLLDKSYPLGSLSPTAITGQLLQDLWSTEILDMRRDNVDALRWLIVDYEFLYESAVRQSNSVTQTNHADEAAGESPFVLQSFGSLCKAAVAFLEDSSRFADLRRLIPSMCAIIVKNEHESLDEQKRYLERILRSREDASVKLQRLRDIAHDIERDDPPEGAATDDRLPTIVGLISDHFLDHYNLDQGAAFWERLARTDRLLGFLVRLYQQPWRPLGISVLLFVVLAGLAYLNVRVYGWAASWQSRIPYLALIPLGAVYLGVGWTVGYVGYRLWWRRDLYYGQLFLPRLFGAIIVGLSVLLVDDMPWKIGVQSQPLNFLLICFLVYLLSFLYIFLDVYKTVKFQPTLPDSVATDSQRVSPAATNRWARLRSLLRRRGRLSKRRRRESVAERTVALSWRVYSVGLLESFVAVLITTTAIYPATGLDLPPDFIGRIVFPPTRWGTLTFFPALVLLWTGLALFIGAFVQLIWQDRRITSPA